MSATDATISTPEVLSVAICLFNDVELLDYAGPLELLGYLNVARQNSAPELGQMTPPPKVLLEFEYLAEKTSVQPFVGPAVTVTATYDAVLASGKPFDVVLVPGGIGCLPGRVPTSLLAFLKAHFNRAKYVLSVCNGSWTLAQAGVLDGRRATTNKAGYKLITAATSPSIEWVPKARWVTDGNYWSSSGVTAGIDMANAWLQHLIGKESAEWIRALVEHTAHEQDQDEWAVVHGLVPAASA